MWSISETLGDCVHVCVLTVKLLLKFLVLDSATLASVKSTSSKMIDWKTN